MSRRTARCDSMMYDVYITGEQLRIQMLEQSQIKDRRYHLRKYKKCFIGKDAVDWLLKLYHVHTREEAVQAMNILMTYGLFHHVVDEHVFKDQHLFYRFTRDDDTYQVNRDLYMFYRGQEIYRRLKLDGDMVMRDFYHKGTLYSDAFYGSDVVDFVTQAEGALERDSVIREFRDLLERDIIKHVTDDYHFNYDRLIYEYSLDFNKPCILLDVIDLVSQRKSSDVTTSSETADLEELQPHRCRRNSPVHVKSSKKAVDPNRSSMHSAASGSNSSSESMASDLTPASVASQKTEPKSVLVRSATVQELEDPGTPYVKRCVQITSDEMGFGFVIRGSAPCYVQAVDPRGPAAAAGMKVRQFVSNVNGRDVLRMDHQQVARLVCEHDYVSITLLIDRIDAQRL